MMAAIRPAGKKPGLWALPKGRIDEGESGEATALREVQEETGARGRSLGKLGDVRYVFTWPPKPAEGERIFKVVSFFLIVYRAAASATSRRSSGTRWPRRNGSRSTTRRASSPTAASGIWPARP